MAVIFPALKPFHYRLDVTNLPSPPYPFYNARSK
jgi:hypothetical protein